MPWRRRRCSAGWCSCCRRRQHSAGEGLAACSSTLAMPTCSYCKPDAQGWRWDHERRRGGQVRADGSEANGNVGLRRQVPPRDRVRPECDTDTTSRVARRSRNSVARPAASAPDRKASARRNSGRLYLHKHATRASTALLLPADGQGATITSSPRFKVQPSCMAADSRRSSVSQHTMQVMLAAMLTTWQMLGCAQALEAVQHAGGSRRRGHGHAGAGPRTG
jgi:hypothetical protein